MAILLEPDAEASRIDTQFHPEPEPADPSASVVECPFVVAIDQREQAPWSFRGITSRCTTRRDVADVLAVRTVRQFLSTADYSIEGHAHEILIERKSKEDLYSTLTHGRVRFERELERMRDLPVAVIVVEASLGEIATRPPAMSRVLPQSITGSVISFQQDFPTIQWIFADSRRLAEIMAFRHLERFYREHLKPRRATKKAPPSTPP